MPDTSPPAHVIVRLPYNRPENAVDPPVVEWSAEKEAYLWDIISRSRGPAGSGTDWQGLSERLKVPLPFLMYRAQVRYEEDLRGLQAAMAEPIVQSIVQPLTIPSPRRQEDKGSNITPPNVSSVGVRTSAASTPRQATPIGMRIRFNSHLRSQPALHSSHRSTSGNVSASTVTLTHRPAAAMSGHSPTHLRPMSPPESRSPSETEDEGEQQDDHDPEAIRKRLKDLERMMTSNVLGFARPKPTLKAADPSSSVIRTSPRNDTTSGGETTSAQSSIPSIPSPPESQLQPPQHTSPHNPQESSQTGRRPQQSRSPPQSPPQQVVRNKMVGKPLPKRSNHGSSTSSFSDISDASISTSALDDALNSNLRQPTGSSRFPGFTRPHFTRIAHHTQPQ